jgi:hypothetical protein
MQAIFQLSNKANYSSTFKIPAPTSSNPSNNTNVSFLNPYIAEELNPF